MATLQFKGKSKEFIFDESAYKEHRKEFDKVLEYINSFKEVVALCGERVITRERTEAWKSRFNFSLHAGKEGFERLINSPQHVLQELRINAIQFGSDLLDRDKLRALAGEVDAFTNAD